MKLIAPVSCLDNDYNDSGIDAVLLNIDTETAQHLLDLRDKCQPMFALSDFYAVELFDYTPEAFCSDGFPPEVGEILGAGVSGVPGVPGLPGVDEWGRVITQVVPDDFSIEPDEENPEAEDSSDGFVMDCCTLLIQKEGVLWKFYRKHTSLQFETADIPWAFIERAVVPADFLNGRHSPSSSTYTPMDAMNRVDHDSERIDPK